MSKGTIYDLEKIKRASQLSDSQLAQVEHQVREEFPSDELMFELHLMRILEALQHGWITVEQALEEPSPAR